MKICLDVDNTGISQPSVDMFEQFERLIHAKRIHLAVCEHGGLGVASGCLLRNHRSHRIHGGGMLYLRKFELKQGVMTTLPGMDDETNLSLQRDLVAWLVMKRGPIEEGFKIWADKYRFKARANVVRSSTLNATAAYILFMGAERQDRRTR